MLGINKTNLITGFRKYLAPAASVWSIGGYIHFLQFLRINETLPPIILHVLFIPALIAEVLWSRYLAGPIIDGGKRPVSYRIAVGGRILFWAVSFVVWVIIIGSKGTTDAIWLKWFNAEFYIWFYLVTRLEGYLGLLAVALAVFAYLLLTVRYRKARLMTSLIIPAALLFCLFNHFNKLGGIGGFADRADVEAQNGVKVVFNPDELSDQVRTISDPREVYFDPVSNTILASYGCSFCSFENEYAAVVSINLDTGEKLFHPSANIRQMAVTEDEIFIAPALWNRKYIYRLDRKTLKVRARHLNQINKTDFWWEPIELIADPKRNRLFLGNNLHPIIGVYRLDSGKISAMLDLEKEGYIENGGQAGNFNIDPKTGLLYAASGPGENLLVIDPERGKVVRSRKLPGVKLGTALALDAESGLLYHQSGMLNELLVIDSKSLEILRTLKGEFHSRKIEIDRDRNCLYELGFASGTVFPIDLKTGERAWTLRVGGKPNGLHFSGGDLWVNSRVGLLRIDLDRVWTESKTP